MENVNVTINEVNLFNFDLIKENLYDIRVRNVIIKKGIVKKVPVEVIIVFWFLRYVFNDFY